MPEPAVPEAQETGRFSFGGPDAGGGDTQRFSFGSAGGGDTQRFSFDGPDLGGLDLGGSELGDSGTGRFSSGGRGRGRPADEADLPSGLPGAPAGGSPASGFPSAEPVSFASGETGFNAGDPALRDAAPEARGADAGLRDSKPVFGATDPGLGGTGREGDRITFESTFEPATPFTTREPSRDDFPGGEPSRQEEGRLEPAAPTSAPEAAPEYETFRTEPPEPFRAPPAEAFEPFRSTPASGADRSKPPTVERSAPGSFGSAGTPAPDISDSPEPSAPAEPEAFSGFSGFSASSSFTRDRETAFPPGRAASAPDPDAASRRAAPASDPDTASRRAASAFDPDAPASAEETPAPSGERADAFAPIRDTAEPAREPYQARRRQSAPPPAFPPSRQQGTGAPRPSADSLDPDSLLRGRRNAPSGGWRKLVYKASAGLIKPGESPEVRRRRELITRARTPVATGHHRVAVLSLKGGVGKTTTTVGLGATLAQVRGDRVIAVDANPDRGTLSDKVELETSATVRDLLNERQQIRRYVDIRAFTSQAPSRLEILASDRDPSVSEAFGASDYQAVAQVLENFYSICITDCGTGLLHSAMSGVLGLADQLVLVSSPSVDGARAASATLDWLEAHHYENLVRSATVVLCSVRPRSKSTVDLDRLEAHFAARCRAVVRVPYDPHLEEGAEIDLERLQAATRDSYLRLAASVGDGFAGGPQT